MLFDLNVSHPTYFKPASEPPRAEIRSASPILEYHEFVRQQAPQAPRAELSYEVLPQPPSQSFPRSMGPSGYVPSMLHGNYHRQADQSQTSCMDSQAHLRSCRACQRFVLKQLWDEIGFFVLIGLIVITLLRK